jgi:6-phosphofructokinase
MTTLRKRVAILVGATGPGVINSVIGAAIIRGELEGVDVVGIRDGFKRFMQGNIDHVTPLHDRRRETHQLSRR